MRPRQCWLLFNVTEQTGPCDRGARVAQLGRWAEASSIIKPGVANVGASQSPFQIDGIGDGQSPEVGEGKIRCYGDVD